MARQSNIDIVRSYTKSTPARLACMAEALVTVDKDDIPGDVVECGVWKGGNIMLTRLMSPARTCWLYDTFDGMTEPGDFDQKRTLNGIPGEMAIDRWRAYKNGKKWDAVSLDDVQLGFAEAGIDTSKCHFVEGAVETSLFTVSPLRIAILRLDVDWHLPTKVALEVLYPRISLGGFLIVDDYGHWLGCKKAVDDYFGVGMPPYRDADYSCRVFRK